MKDELNLEKLWELFKKVGLSNPENLEYIIGKLDGAIELFNEKIENALVYAEKTTLEGKSLDFSKEGPLGIYDTMFKNPSPYSIFLEPCLMMLEETIRSAAKQRKLFEFYEPESEQPRCMMWNAPEKQNIKAFIKEGDEFYVQTLEWRKFKRGQYDKIPFSYIDARNLKITESKKERWDKSRGDYQGLVHRIQEESKNYSSVLVKFPSELPYITKILTIITGFLPVFDKYHTIKNKTH